MKLQFFLPVPPPLPPPLKNNFSPDKTLNVEYSSSWLTIQEEDTQIT